MILSRNSFADFLIILTLQEVWHDFKPRPTRCAVHGPSVIVRCVASHVHHTVDHGTPTWNKLNNAFTLIIMRICFLNQIFLNGILIHSLYLYLHHLIINAIFKLTKNLDFRFVISTLPYFV